MFALSMYDPVLGHSVVMSSAGCGPCPIRQGLSLRIRAHLQLHQPRRIRKGGGVHRLCEDETSFQGALPPRPARRQKLGAHVMAAQGRGSVLKNSRKAKV
jgi:hypothetical protein